jgi:cob(I)alamin adenosyltransferase
MIDEEPVEASTHEPPTERPARATQHAPSRVLVHTGDGKGKSSAAMGVMLRAVSAGWKVAVIQFVKSGKWRTGEEAAGRALGVEWWSAGDGFTWDSTDMDRTEAIAREAWLAAAELIRAGKHRLVILDEITYPMNWGWIDTSEVVQIVRSRPHDVSIVVTGRKAPAQLREIADTVTEMVSEKHAFDQGLSAMRGIEF